MRPVWDKPVKVGTGLGYQLAVAGPEDALTYLCQWPGEESEFVRDARRLCQRSQLNSLGQARRAFVAAFLNARMAFA